MPLSNMLQSGAAPVPFAESCNDGRTVRCCRANEARVLARAAVVCIQHAPCEGAA